MRKSSSPLSAAVAVAVASMTVLLLQGDLSDRAVVVWGWTAPTTPMMMTMSSGGPTRTTRATSASALLPPRRIHTTTSSLSSALVDSEQISSAAAAAAAEAAAEAEAKKSYLDDGFVFGLVGSGLERPTGKVAQVVVEGDSLETTPLQRTIVWTTLIGNALFAASALQQMLLLNNGNVVQTTIQAVVLAISSWMFADFGSGVLHWSVDNYGNGRTPVMGGIIAAFQGHHSAPWTITERGFENNVYKLCAPFGIVTVGLISLLAGPFTSWFMSIFCTMEILSQEFHKWSHTTKSQVPSWTNKLQEWGVTIGRTPHAQHHIAPYDGNYCIVSGICNPTLDKYGIFRRMEHLVYKLNGVESNAWKLDPELKQRTLEGNYMLP